MEQRIRRFKQSLQREVPRRGRGVRFPATLVAEAVTIAKEAQAADWSLPDLARVLGIGVATLERWCERDHETVQFPAAMQPVTVVPATICPGSPGMVVHGPSALRVEGLDLDDLVALWRKLA